MKKHSVLLLSGLLFLQLFTARADERPIWASASGEDERGAWADFAVNGATQRMRYIPAGTFIMGSPETEEFRQAGEIQHPVTLTEPFWLADSELTQALWTNVTAFNRSRWDDDPNLPVENVSWNDGKKFFQGLEKIIPGLKACYPTEAQWEYACRAGTAGPRYADMTNISWWAGNANYRTHPVKQRPPNSWGLYDMHGNVHEWCEDWYVPYSGQPETNPSPASGEGRIVRGGWAVDAAQTMRAAHRLGGDHPGGRYGNTGLRICIPASVSSVEKAEAVVSIPSKPILLWPEGAPGAMGDTDEDKPSITAYIPEHPNGASMLIVPGGGYHILVDYEGRDFALFLNKYGITGFVLKHRLGKRGGDFTKGYRHPIMMNDAARALRLIRTKAPEWGIDPARIGMMGCSSGGHLTSTMMTHFDYGNPETADPVDRASSRPDVAILCYPVVKISDQQWTMKMLLGMGEIDPKLIDELSAEKNIRPDTPPCFMLHTFEDSISTLNSVDLAAALHKQGVPYELHVFEKGKHGLSLCDKPPFTDPHPWAKDLTFWLEIRNFINRQGTEQ